MVLTKRTFRRGKKRVRRRQPRRFGLSSIAPSKINSLYRNATPRTLQIATRRNKALTLRFVKNMTFLLDPQLLANKPENMYLSIRANSIYNIFQQDGAQNIPGTWTSISPEYGDGVTTNMDGFDDYKNKYQHFVVKSARVQATFTPFRTAADGADIPYPAQLYIHKSGIAAGGNHPVTPTLQNWQLQKLPYLVKADVNATYGMSNTGVRLFMNYSARSFESINDVVGASQLRGHFPNPVDGTGAQQPSETSFFTIGLINQMKSGDADGHKAPRGYLTIKLEQIVHLAEPQAVNDYLTPNVEEIAV
jgi:hypothetical protein